MTAASPSAQSAHELARQERRQARIERWKLLRRRPGFIIGSIILLGWIVCAVGGENVTPYGPYELGFPTSEAPSAAHPFGTDNLGRDVLSRVMAGARDVLIIAPIAAVIAVACGTFLGLLSGYVRGLTDDGIGRVMEAVLSIPVILIGLLVLTTLGSSNLVLIFTVALLFTPIVYRTVRTAVLGEAQLDYVTAAKLRGESGLFIMTREILPNITGPIVVELTVRIGYAIFTVATLRFVAGGGEPDSPDWGNTINQMYDLIPSGVWWPTIFPALAIASLVIAVNLIADSLESVYAS